MNLDLGINMCLDKLQLSFRYFLAKNSEFEKDLKFLITTCDLFSVENVIGMWAVVQSKTSTSKYVSIEVIW